MAAKRGLGKGLNKLFSADGTEGSEKTESPKKVSTKEEPKKEKEVIKEVVKEVIKEVPANTMLKITEIEPNRAQPRKDFNEDALLELADSIKKYGVIEPIVVSKKGKSYVIIAGERRWRAARQAGLKEVPVVVREYTDKERMEVALIENLQREDLNPIEEAQAYQRLINEFQLKQDDVAERVSKSRTAITNILRLLKLSEAVQEMVIDEKLSNGHARALLSIEDPELQYETACKVFDERLSVRETEKLVKKIINQPPNPKNEKEEAAEEDLSFLYKDLEEKFKYKLGAKTTIKPKNNNKGKIEIEYFSKEELEHIMEMIYSIQN